MKTRASFLLWLKSHKVNAKGLAPISCRVTVGGRRAELTTNIRVAPTEWSDARKKVLGTTPTARAANAALGKILNELADIHADLERQGKVVTAQTLATRYRKPPATGQTLLEVYRAFIAERKQLVGVEIAHGTTKGNNTAYNRLQDYLQATKQTAMLPEEVTQSFADRLLHWCLTTKGFKRATANKIVRQLSQVLRWGVRRELLDKNPLADYQYKVPATGEIKYLGVGEIALLTQAELPDTLARVRDFFLFQCWTGLAYADLLAVNVAAAEYHTDRNGQVRRVLRGWRAKSTIIKGFEYVIPLLPEAERILALYNDSLPVPTNQVYNRQLKELGQAVGLEAEKMTSHVGRKTAGTLLLNMGVALPVVSKFLGHSNTLITQKIYAKLLDTTVVDAFAIFGGSTPPAPRVQPKVIALSVAQSPRLARRLKMQRGGQAA